MITEEDKTYLKLTYGIDIDNPFASCSYPAFFEVYKEYIRRIIDRHYSIHEKEIIFKEILIKFLLRDRND